MEGLKLAIPHRLMLLRLSVVFSLLLSLLFSYRLWFSDRHFPFVPLFDLPLNFVLFSRLVTVLLILVLLGSVFLRGQRVLLFVAVLCLCALVFTDLTRLQWWVFYYGCMLWIFVLYSGRVDDANKYTTFFIVLQVMAAAVYFFSGIHQLNANFIRSEYTTIIAPLRGMVSERQFGLFVNLGAVVPWTLIFIGIGLTVTALRYLAITLACIMHVVLLILQPLSDGPSDWVLWVSNVNFLIMIFLLFSGKTKQRYFSPAVLFQRPVFYLTFIFFFVMPWFNHAGKWPDSLSFNIKSGNAARARMVLREEVLQGLPIYLVKFCDRNNEEIELYYQQWCLDELGAECFDGGRTYTEIGWKLHLLSGMPQNYIKTTVLPRYPLLFKP
jgi:hypothetical protein